MSGNEKNSVKTSWIHITVSAPIIVFIALPIILLTFCAFHEFKDDFITIFFLTITGIIILIFLYLALCRPENLTIDGRGHLSMKRDEAKRKIGGQQS